MDAQTSRISGALWKFIAGSIAIIAPATLLISSSNIGMGEYPFNVWFLAYNGEYFKQHDNFPVTYQSFDHVGVAAPLLYGCILFRVGGLLSWAFGCHIAFRIIVLLCFASVYFGVRHGCRKLGATEVLSTLIACSMCWTIYPLTNLYTRCAFSEFVAASMLTCSCCLWTAFFFRPRPSGNLYTALTAGFFQVIAMGTHPITGMFSIPIVVVIYSLHWIVHVPDRPSFLRMHWQVLISGVLACLVLASWLFAYFEIGKNTYITLTMNGLWNVEIDTTTAIYNRLFPIPMNPGRLNPGIPYNTDHLDLQINLPLLSIALVLSVGACRHSSWQDRFRLIGGLFPIVLLAGIAFVVSVYPHSKNKELPSIFWKAQLNYRYINVINLSILIALFVTLSFRHSKSCLLRSESATIVRCLLLLIGVWAATNLILKIKDSSIILFPYTTPNENDELRYQEWLLTCGPKHAFSDYNALNFAEELTNKETENFALRDFQIGTGTEFGDALPLHVTAKSDGYIGTQALPLQWSEFWVDGKRIPTEQLRIWHVPDQPVPLRSMRIAVPVPAGSHTIEFRATPPNSWLWLNRVANLVFVLWFGLAIFLLSKTSFIRIQNLFRRQSKGEIHPLSQHLDSLPRAA
jgi:hypothetical protein